MHRRCGACLSCVARSPLRVNRLLYESRSPHSKAPAVSRDVPVTHSLADAASDSPYRVWSVGARRASKQGEKAAEGGVERRADGAAEVSVADDASQGSMDKEGCVVSSDSQQSNRSVTFVVRNATLLPCTWLASRGGSQCEHAPTIRLSAEMGSTTVTQLRHEQRLCRDRFFNDNLVKLRGDALLLSSSPSEQLPLSPDTDLVILVDAFGLSSIYHSTIDLLLPVAATARGTRSPSSRAVACSAAISKAGPIRRPQRPMSFARRSAARRLNLRSITRQAAWRVENLNVGIRSERWLSVQPSA